MKKPAKISNRKDIESKLDLGLALLMKQVDRTKKVNRSRIMKKLKSK